MWPLYSRVHHHVQVVVAGEVVAVHSSGDIHEELATAGVGGPGLSAVDVADLVAEHAVEGVSHEGLGDHDLCAVQDAAGVEVHVLAGHGAAENADVARVALPEEEQISKIIKKDR